MVKIEVLGTGCAKCISLEDNVKQAIKMLGIEAEVVKVSDMKEIMNYGVMMTPALVVDGVIKSAGKLLSPEDITKILKA